MRSGVDTELACQGRRVQCLAPEQVDASCLACARLHGDMEVILVEPVLRAGISNAERHFLGKVVDDYHRSIFGRLPAPDTTGLGWALNKAVRSERASERGRRRFLEQWALVFGAARKFACFFLEGAREGLDTKKY